jgi:hypothetical protein
MGRKQLIDRPVRWNIHIPQSLDEMLNGFIHDEILGGPTYSARSVIVKQLLSELIVDFKAGRAMFDPYTRRIIRKERSDD